MPTPVAAPMKASAARLGRRLLATLALAGQALGIPLVAGLFVGLVTGTLKSDCLCPQWPPRPDALDPLVELLLLCAPAMLAFPALARKSGGFRHYALFVLMATTMAGLAIASHAQAFGLTWTNREIFEGLFLQQLHLLALAFVPGVLWLAMLRTMAIRAL